MGDGWQGFQNRMAVMHSDASVRPHYPPPVPIPLQSPDFTKPPPMLTSLYVRHFAVVEEAEIAFGPGLDRRAHV